MVSLEMYRIAAATLAAALFDALEFFRPLCGASQPAWQRVAEQVTKEVYRLTNDATFRVDASDCHSRFKAFQKMPDPTGGADSPDPVKRLIGPMKDLQSQFDHEQASGRSAHVMGSVFDHPHVAVLQGGRGPKANLKGSGSGSDYSKSVPPPPKDAKVKHHEPRGPPAEKRGAPHKGANKHASTLLASIAAIGSGLGSSGSSLGKDEFEATIARRNSLKQKLDMLVLAKEQSPDDVPDEVVAAARAAWIADLTAPATSPDAPVTGKRSRDGAPVSLIDVAPLQH